MSFHDPYRPTSSIGNGASAPKVAQPEDESKKVPSGTAKEVLAWVDGDQERAQLALEVEESHKQPRKTLVKDLRDLTEDDEDE